MTGNEDLYADPAPAIRRGGIKWLVIGIAMIGVCVWFVMRLLDGGSPMGSFMVQPGLIVGMLFLMRGLVELISGKSWSDLSKAKRVGLLVLGFLGPPILAFLILVL